MKQSSCVSELAEPEGDRVDVGVELETTDAQANAFIRGSAFGVLISCELLMVVGANED